MAKDRRNRGSLKERLQNLQKDWESSEPKVGGAKVPDNNYTAKITGAFVEEAKSSGRLQIHWILLVADGEYEGREIHKRDGIDTAENLPYVQGSLQVLNLNIPDSIDDIGDVLENAVGLLVDITVATSDEFTNIYFNELLEDFDSDTGKNKKPKESKDGEEGENLPTRDEIRDMSKLELAQVIKEHKLDINTGKLGSVEAIQRAVIKALL